MCLLWRYGPQFHLLLKGREYYWKEKMEKKLCINCTVKQHRASECRSKRTCSTCNERHQSPICSMPFPSVTTMSSADQEDVTHPVVAILVDGVKCRTFLDTGAGSLYVSAGLMNVLRKKPIRKETKHIEMMMNSTTKNIEVLEVQIENIHRDISFETELCKVERRELLKLPKPHYADLIKRHYHLGGIVMDYNDQNKELPVHVILGASDYSRIKTMKKPRIGQPGEPVAEKTQLGWTIFSPGHESEGLSNMLLTRNSTCHHDQLCRLDVLVIDDQPSVDQEFIYKQFKDWLQRHPECFYKTPSIWKVGHSTLNINKAGSLLRLKRLLGKLRKDPEIFEQYDNIMIQYDSNPTKWQRILYST